MMYKFFLLCFLSITNLAHAVEIEVQIQKKYQSISNIKAIFEQTLEHKESNTKQIRQGELIFSKPFLVRWETKQPNPELLLITSKAVWNYLPDEEVAYKYTPDIVNNSKVLVQVITGQAELNKDFKVINLGRDLDYTKLQLFPNEPTPNMVEALIWVDDKNVIRQAKLVDFYGNSNTLSFKKITLNTILSKNSFEFTPPDGIDIEDRTKQK